LKILHACDPQGKIYVGVDAFILIWQNIPQWRILASLVSVGFVHYFAKVFYQLFASWRFNKLSHCYIALKDNDLTKK
jgi:predicted DCC family thiol-disulfide oxidoreductase YuxK